MKRYICIAWILMMLVALALPAHAAGEETSGPCGDNLTWTLSDGTLTISGAGDMTDYPYPEARAWNDAMHEEIKKIVIGSGVTGISDWAFSYGYDVESVEFEQGSRLAGIGRGAFHSLGIFAKNGASIALPEGVKTIGEYAFCLANLTELKIPASAESIGEKCFEGCQKLIIDVADDSAFFKLDNGVLLTGDGKTLLYCPPALKLAAYAVPDGVETIAASAFNRCTALKRVTLPASLKTLEEGAFLNCTSLLNAEFSNGLARIGNSAFAGCSGLANLVLPDSLREIGNQAFYVCSGLTVVSIPSGVTALGGMAFANCAGLKSVILPESVAGIGTDAFSIIDGWGEGAIGADFKPASDFVLYGYAGSAAETYANEDGVTFIALSHGAAMVNFVRRYACPGGSFTDVDEGSWYGLEKQGVVASACALGIMNGMGDGTFSPNGNMKLSEAIKMADVVYDIYHGGSGVIAETEDGKWYNRYVAYAVAHGIISENAFTDYEANATRAEMARIFAAALPESALTALNTVNAVPDVSSSDADGADIYLLYRAGVLTGDAGTHAFRPNDPVTRAEAAAIIARLALTEKRMAVSL